MTLSQALVEYRSRFPKGLSLPPCDGRPSWPQKLLVEINVRNWRAPSRRSR